MTVVRRVNRPADQFTMVSNGFVRDVRLSFHARGVGLWLLSHTEGWECSTERIAQEAGAGRDQIRRALRELEAARYLRRVRERSPQGKLGAMLYEVQCVPFEDETPGQDQRLETQALAGQALADNQHKKTNSKKITEEDQPSGRDRAAAQPAGAEEEAEMPKPSPDQEALFPSPEKAKRPRKAPKLPEGPAAAVAAYVESYTQHHGGQRPLNSSIGKVGAAAKSILSKGDATQEELLRCCEKMGRGPYTNLHHELQFSRPAQRAFAAKRDDADRWADMSAATAERVRQLTASAVPA